MTNSSAQTPDKSAVLIIATASAFLIPFLTSSVIVALPQMGRDLHMEAVAISWVTTIYFLAIVMVQVPMGRLADIYGRKKIFLWGLFITILGSAAGALANSTAMLLISRAFQGFGAGMTYNVVIAILTSVYPAEKRGQALGINQAAVYAGLIFGPFIGGLMTERFGWQSLFILSGLFSLFLVILIFLTLKKEWREARGEKFDVSGTIVFGIAIAMFMYGFSVLVTVPGIIFLLLGAAGLIYFGRQELRVASPLLDFRIFKTNRVFLFSNLAMLINYLATYALTFLLSLYLQYIKALSADQAGLALIASSIPMAILAPLSGRLSDRIDPVLVAAVGQMVNCVSLAMLIFLGNATPVWFVIIALVLYGTGIGLFSSPNTNAVMGSVEKKALGVASGAIGTMRTAGMMLSMGIMMILFTVYIGQSEILPVNYPQFLTSVRVGFVVFTALGIIGLLAQLAGRRTA